MPQISRTAQRDALDKLDLNAETQRVVDFYRKRYEANYSPVNREANRDELIEATGMSVQAASGRTSDAEKAGCLYKTGRRRGRQSCLIYEPDPAKWSRRAADYRNTRRFKRGQGFLEEYGLDMAPGFRKDFERFISQNRIG